MITDASLTFCNRTNLSTVGTGRALIGDVIDLLLPSSPDQMVVTDSLYLVITVTQAVTSVGNATVGFELVSDGQAAIATDGSATSHFSQPATEFPKASLVPGFKAVIAELPPGPYERYLGILQNVGTAALTGGAISAFLTHDPANYKNYPAGI